jgi:integrase
LKVTASEPTLVVTAERPGGAGTPRGMAGTSGGPDVTRVSTVGASGPIDDVTLEAWSNEWLGFSVHLKPKTRVGYESLLRTRILPAFGTLSLESIDGLAIRRWVARMHAEGLSASRTQQSYRLLSQMLSSAIDCGLLDRNPSHGVKLPRSVRSEMTCLTAAEVERLTTAIASAYRPLIHILAYGGLRWGEATALRRNRCDLDAHRLIVAESLADVNGRVVFGETKTHRVRKTRLPDFLVEELRVHLETVGAEPVALLFTAPRGGPLRIANFRRRVWWPALEVADLPHSTRIHDLRHTCASLLIRQGVHPKAIQSHLGHASIQITMDRYGHLLPDQFDDLASRLDMVHADVTTTPD